MTQEEWSSGIADYVLGHMDDSARTAFELRMATDAALVRQVAGLATRLAALDETAHPENVPHDLWTRIEARLEGAAQPRPANANMRAHAGRDMTGALRRGAMAASIVIALGVGFAGGLMVQPTPPTPVVIAVLATDDMQPGAIIEAFGDDSIRIIPLEALIAPQGNVLEVWTLPDVETGPVSLGIFERATDLVLTGPNLPPPQPDQLYEITLEPEGGSPTGRPTGPILMKGFARAPVI